MISTPKGQWFYENSKIRVNKRLNLMTVYETNPTTIWRRGKVTFKDGPWFFLKVNQSDTRLGGWDARVHGRTPNCPRRTASMPLGGGTQVSVPPLLQAAAK